MPNGKNNPCNRKNFEMAVAMLRFIVPETKFTVEETYLDYGAGMKWETIIATRDWNGGTDYQMLSPREWDELYMADTVFDVAQIVTRLVKEQGKLLRPKT